MLIVFFILCAIFYVIFMFQFKIVNQTEVLIIERFRKYKRTAGPGLVWVWPFIERIKARVDLKEEILYVKLQDVNTKDNVTIQINTAVAYKITDPLSAVYEIDDIVSHIEYFSKLAVIETVNNTNLDSILNSEDFFADEIRYIINPKINKWGCKITIVFIKDITFQKD